MQIALFLLWITSPCAPPTAAPADERFSVRLTVYDQITQPGETIPLQAKLEHPGIWAMHLHMRGYPLRFTMPGIFDQEVKTAEEATATVHWQVRANRPAIYWLQVSFAGSAHHQPARSVSGVYVWPRDSRILITDIDHTISNLSELMVPFTTNQATPPLAGAVETLRQLAGSYGIIYLTARDEILYERTRAWLIEKGFPAGPLVCRDFHVGGTQGGFKRQFIGELKKRFPNIAVGVGDQVSDAHAYLKNGLKAFLIEPRETGIPKEAIVVHSWQEVRQQLAKDLYGR